MTWACSVFLTAFVVSIPPNLHLEATSAAAYDDGAQHQGEAGEPDGHRARGGHVARAMRMKAGG